MMIVNDILFQIYFGDATDGLHPSFYAQWHDTHILEKSEISLAVRKLSLSNLLFLRQTHSTQGIIIDTSKLGRQPAFFKEGDFLCTDQPGIGLGVMTADCVPVILIDRKKKLVAIAHAGWRGAVDNIMKEVIAALVAKWNSNASQLEIFVGPSAKGCCYEVSPDFQQHLMPYHYKESLIVIKEGELRFDVSQLVMRQLIDFGVASDAICWDYNLCTMCNDQFYSHRRDTVAGNTNAVGRQMSIVALK